MKELGSLRFLLQVRFIATSFCTYYEKNINDRSTPELPEKSTTPRFFFHSCMVGGTNLPPFIQTSVNFRNFA